ncbi:putative hemolysin [Candidatus Sulfopaludibacter sp. SbA3]|nr:putative hemolysin [Candidatus Sulfopaludibacter sp. SbA3]
MRTDFSRESLSISGLLDEPLRSFLNPMEPAIRKLLSLDRLWDLVDNARSGSDAVGRLLSLLSITFQIDAAELNRVPLAGPVLVVSNHPFGLLEGAIMASVLPKLRPDVRILANSMLSVIPELRERCIFIDPFGHQSAMPGNAAALRECLQWLRGGGLLLAFPAGEVAHLDWSGTLADPPWNPPLARIAQLAGATAVPLFFEGGNSMAFQLAGTIHPSLRTASLPRELLNKRGRTIRIRIGRPVNAATLQSFPDPQQAIDYLRCRTELLDSGWEPPRFFPSSLLPPRKPAPVIAPPAADRIAAEIDALPPDRRLCDLGEFAVYVGKAAEFPVTIQEMGRLREVAYRLAGEGTGRPVDLDRFDRHYLHLLLWNHNTREVVGAYRLGPTPDILPRYGIRGLYTSTLFRYRRELFERIGPAVELGRSFIRPQYQKQYAPLLLLWKGIGRYVASRPECTTLFGGVSISNHYTCVSRHLLVKFLEAHRAEELAPLVAPRSPYRPGQRILRRTPLPGIPRDVDELSALIADLEKDGKGVPILIKHYLKTGGRLLGFNVDHRFSNALDALITVDLRLAPDALLDRLLGKPGAEAFRYRQIKR